MVFFLHVFFFSIRFIYFYFLRAYDVLSVAVPHVGKSCDQNVMDFYSVVERQTI
jgi:hypothetical protein